MKARPKILGRLGLYGIGDTLKKIDEATVDSGSAKACGVTSDDTR